MTVQAQATLPDVGDHIPNLELRGPDGQPALGGLLGKWLLFVFLPRSDDLDAQVLEGFEQRREQLAEVGVAVLGFATRAVPRPQDTAATIPVLIDSQAKVFEAFGLSVDSPTHVTFLVDPSLRVVERWIDADASTHAEQVVAEVQRQTSRDPAHNVVSHAPVLIIPNALPPELCRRLIEVWETQGNVDSGSMIMRDGQTVPVYNYDHKIRRDHFMKAGADEEQVKAYIAQRVLPEIRKAFNYNVTRREDFRIACYDASRGGYFRPHRDNTTEGTAHRRFAMSLLLNDDYEGGYLRFPEYGPHLYRPDAGGAVIFSCSLLHEATDVTAGRRFVLLSFFYGEAEARLREQYNRKTGGQYRA